MLERLQHTLPAAASCTAAGGVHWPWRCALTAMSVAEPQGTIAIAGTVATSAAAGLNPTADCHCGLQQLGRVLPSPLPKAPRLALAQESRAALRLCRTT